LEGLDAQRQIVDNFVLRIKSLLHLVLQLFSEFHEFNHRLLLELLDVLVLAFELGGSVILEGAELE
jgi:hypothetical protein